MYQASGTGIEGNMAIDQTAFERDWQQQVIRELCVDAHFDANTELERRVAFLSDYPSDAGLTKRRAMELARVLGASDLLVTKVPTADLETLAPAKGRRRQLWNRLR